MVVPGVFTTTKSKQAICNESPFPRVWLIESYLEPRLKPSMQYLGRYGAIQQFRMPNVY